MTPFPFWTRFSLMLVWTAVASGYVATQNKQVEQDRVAFAQAFPRLDGAHLRATIVKITYGPGGSSPPHSHPCPVIGYILQGVLRTQLKGEPAKIYKTGDTFYEAPGGVHLISANASDSAPVKFLAYFVCDTDTPLSVAPPETSFSGGKP